MQVSVLVGILTTMLSNDIVNATMLSEKYELSKRTIYRYITVLGEAGVPIVSHSGRNGGWSILSTYKLRSMYFTKEEYSRMLLVIKGSALQDGVTKSVVDKLSGMSNSAYNSIVLQSKQLIVDTSINEKLQERVDTLQKALNTNKVIIMEYHSQKGETLVRSAEPYALVLKNDQWYLYAYCLLRNDFRYFKIARIANLTVSEHTFRPRPFDVDCAAIESDMVRGKQRCEIILTVYPEALTDVEEWLGIEQVAKVGEQYTARAEVPYDDLLIKRILSFGSGVRVERPSQLIDDVRQRCKDIVSIYGD